MRNLITILLVILPAFLAAQSKPVKILFDVTSKDTLTHQAVLRHVEGMARNYPDAQFEVVVYGGAWPMLVAGKTSTDEIVQELASRNNISFKICGITMARHSVESSDLVSGVEVVPDAIMEIVTRQGDGWGYIKESHN